MILNEKLLLENRFREIQIFNKCTSKSRKSKNARIKRN
jgi:hypothetical protein